MALRAIAAMSLNRVIGRDGRIPWDIPADFKWFKKMTTGQAILMGRKTFDSLGKPLPNRRNLVVTRAAQIDGVEIINDLTAFRPRDYPTDVWLICGEELFRQMLDKCDDLYLSVIPRIIEGDTYFPPFEHQFDLAGVVLEDPDFQVKHYKRKARLRVA